MTDNFDVEIPQHIRKTLSDRKHKEFSTLFDLPYSQDATDTDYAILGFPCDYSTADNSGSRFGPKAIRSAYSGSRLDYEQDNCFKADNITGVDMGDLEAIAGYPHECLRLAYESILKILDTGATPIILGGDQTVTYAQLKAQSKKQPHAQTAIVHFDALEDTMHYLPTTRLMNNTALRCAIDDGLVDTHHSIQVGIRPAWDTYRLTYAKKHNMDVLLADQIRKIGLQKAAKIISEKVQNKPCIISFDVSFLDCIFAPSASRPSSGGFSTFEACELIRLALSNLNIVGFDIVEVTSNSDFSEITSMSALAVVKQFVMILAQKKSGIFKTYNNQEKK